MVDNTVNDLDHVSPHGVKASKKIRRYAADQMRRAADGMLNELLSAVRDCQARGGDCAGIRVCVGDVCRSLSSPISAADTGASASDASAP